MRAGACRGQRPNLKLGWAVRPRDWGSHPLKALACVALVSGASLLVGCGGFSGKDAERANRIVNSSRANLELCAPDASTCMPAHVRALSTVDFCQAASMLVEHGSPMPEGGPPCPTTP